MALGSGVRLGPYEIVSAIGAGGMGEVYRGRGTKLHRDVAIKILPDALASDAAARARFEREAQAVAALSHPNILGIFDFGVEHDVPFAVMELLDGVTLREQAHDGAIGPRKAIEYAQQIAAGLGAAHAHGITHRDLKPENVFVTRDGRIKILDFGLAKVGAGAGAGAGVSLSMMATSPALTGAGTIVGTVGYMAPEQVRGREVDHRTDIFSFGAILYELVAGRRAFTGDSAVETMNAILKEDPPELTRTNAALPPALDRIIRRCLEKNPDERFQSARDVAFALDAISTTRSDAAVSALDAPRTFITRGRWPLAAAIVLVVGAAAGWRIGRGSIPLATEDSVTRFTVGGTEGVRVYFYSPPAVSPDGREVAFVGSEPDGRVRIWVRPLEKTTASPIAGTENAWAPFWSPDGTFLAFYADGKLKKIRAAGGPTETLCDARGGEGAGGTWSSSGTIVFTNANADGLRRIPASGGEATMITHADTSIGEAGHMWPQFLPDARHFLYTVSYSGSARRVAFVGSIDSQDRRELTEVRSYMSYAPSGYVTFVRQGSLMAQRFDADALQLSGEPLTLTDEMRNVYATFSVGGNTLVYLTASRNTALAWFDRAGKQFRSIPTAGEFGWPALSPDGHRIAIDRIDPDTGLRAIWLVDDDRSTATRLTRDTTDESDVVWAPDGSRIAFSHDDGHAVHEIPLTSTSSQRALASFDRASQAYPTDWSSDGDFIAYSGWGPTNTSDVWILPLAAGAKPIPIAATKAQEGQARFSPDGRWIAYTSDESGRPEVYVQAMPPGQARFAISVNGGAEPMWRRDGKELFYLTLDNTLMAVPLRSSTGIDAGAAVALFKVRIDESNSTAVRNHYAASADGQRFLINSVTAGNNQLSVVLHWRALLGETRPNE
jgi:Tol biopolymer transport system component/tRNA A-37 threonylcarbamoyl transferase component Bud32